MKLLVSLFAVTMLFSCAEKSTNALSDAQKTKIQEEIKPVIAQLIDAAAHADTAKLYETFSFSDQFYLDITGAFFDPPAYKNMVAGYWGMINSEILANGAEKYNYLSATDVLYSYSGVVTVNFKNGQQAIYKPFGMTLLFKKKDNGWKIVFVQESTQEPAPAPADSVTH